MWISPAALGAVSPILIVQALTSFTPAVKYVCSPKSLNPALISLLSPGSLTPKASKNSFLL